MMLVVRPGRGTTRRPAAPSRKLPTAHMGRASFLRLTGIWLGAVLALLAIVLAIRWLS